MTVAFGTALAAAGCSGGSEGGSGGGDLEGTVARECERLELYDHSPRDECACLARGFVVAVAESIRGMTEAEAHSVARMLQEARSRDDLGFRWPGRYDDGVFDDTANNYDLSFEAKVNYLAFASTCWQSDASSWDD